MEEGKSKGGVDPANLLTLFTDMVAEVLHGGDRGQSLVQRTRAAVMDRAPRFRLAARSASADILRWVHRGGAWRALLVTAVGIAVFVALASLATFTLFFVTATVNAVALAFLMSLSGVGAFMAAFFLMLSVVYVGALVVVAFAISTIAFFTISAVVLATAWIGFFWLAWLGGTKFFDLCSVSLAATAATISGLSSATGSIQTTSVEKQHSPVNGDLLDD